MSTIRINSVRDLNGTDFAPFSNQYGAKAIVQFDGYNGANEIEYSKNISSVTDAATGQYRAYYTSQFNANYDTVGSLCSDRNAFPLIGGASTNLSLLDYLNMRCENYNYTAYGDTGAHGIVYGDLA